MKECAICKVDKPLSEFHKQASRKDGFCSWCKPCKSIKKAESYKSNSGPAKKIMAEYRKANPEKVSEAKKQCYRNKRKQYLKRCSEYYKENRESRLEYGEKYRAEKRQEIILRQAGYRDRNRTHLNERQSIYQSDNKDARNEYSKKYIQQRLKEDPLFALTYRARNGVRNALKSKGYTKKPNTHEILGCCFQTLSDHLELKFTNGMDWENRGEWHVDHIIPLASAQTEKELLDLCHYTNLQPLWAHDNLSKGAKMSNEKRASQ